jgi:hypothetical protein
VETTLKVGVGRIVVDLAVVLLDLLCDLVVVGFPTRRLQQALFVPFIAIRRDGIEPWRVMMSIFGLSTRRESLTPMKYQRIHRKGGSVDRRAAKQGRGENIDRILRFYIRIEFVLTRVATERIGPLGNEQVLHIVIHQRSLARRSNKDSEPGRLNLKGDGVSKRVFLGLVVCSLDRRIFWTTTSKT